MSVSTDLIIGVILTALSYAFLIWAVVHGKHVVERIQRGEYPAHPNPDHSTKSPDARKREDRDD